MNAVRFLFVAWSLWMPVDEKVEGCYADYLITDTAWVQVWGEQREVVTQVAETCGFEVLASSRNILLVKYNSKCPDFRLNLSRLASDAGVEKISAAHYRRPH